MPRLRYPSDRSVAADVLIRAEPDEDEEDNDNEEDDGNGYSE